MVLKIYPGTLFFRPPITKSRATLRRAVEGESGAFLTPIAIAAIIIADQDLFRDTVDSLTYGFNERTFFRIGKLVHLCHPAGPEN